MKKILLTAASAAMLAATASSHAATATNDMTNIVVLTDTCSMIAVGIDFGVRPNTSAAAITGVTTSNNTAGNLTTNTNHSQKGADGGANDTLTLNLGGLVDLGPALSGLGALPTAGVHVACSGGAPTSVTVKSTKDGAVAADNAELIAGTDMALSSDMDNGATALPYTITFAAAADIPDLPDTGLFPTIYLKSFFATGEIPAYSEKTAGEYTDVVEVEMVF